MMTGTQIATAMVAFIGTTIDDLVVLAALFLARRVHGRPGAIVIVAGQYLGFGAVIALAAATAAGLQIVPQRWIGLLGLIPIGFGIRGLWRLRGTDADSRPPLAATIGAIAGLTFANGADNIAVFTPLFRTIGPAGSALTTALFLALIALWCTAAALLGSYQPVVTTLGRVAHWLVPAVFIGVGMAILITSDTLTAIRHNLAWIT